MSPTITSAWTHPIKYFSSALFLLAVFGLPSPASSLALGRLAATRLARRHVHVRAQGPGVEKAGTFLAKLLADAVTRMKANPHEPLVFKKFVFRAKTTHRRRVAGERFEDYMSLPVEQYVLFDPRLMRRIGDDMFEFSVPLEMGGGLDVRPTWCLRVVQDLGSSAVRVESVNASLYGRGSAPPPQLAQLGEDGVEEATANGTTGETTRAAGLGLNASLEWTSPWRQENQSQLRVAVLVSLEMLLPPPFSKMPRPLVEGAVNVIMRSATQLLVPKFVDLLEADYGRWRNGTRDAAIPVGELIGNSSKTTAEMEQSE